MKILFLVDAYYPFLGGVQAVTQYLAEGLAVRHEVLVITALKGIEIRHEVYNNVMIERYDIKRDSITMGYKGEKRRICRRIKNFVPDILIVTCIGSWTFDITQKCIGFLPGKKVLYTHGCTQPREYSIWNKVRALKKNGFSVWDIHKIYVEFYWKQYFKNLVSNMKKYDLIIYLEEQELEYYRDNQNIQNGVVLGNAVEDSFFSHKAFDKKVADENVFLNISNYSNRKNQKLILEAFAKANIPKTRLILIGSKENDYYYDLVRLYDEVCTINQEMKEKISIYCGITREKTKELFFESNIYVSASEWEGISISLSEAAAGGMTIISTNTGHAAQIDGVMLFDGKEELIEKMKIACQNPELRKQNGEMAYYYARRHHVIADKVKQFEDALLNL